jgi:hypothetical protein
MEGERSITPHTPGQKFEDLCVRVGWGRCTRVAVYGCGVCVCVTVGCVVVGCPVVLCGGSMWWQCEVVMGALLSMCVMQVHIRKAVSGWR